jgi:N-acyl-D-amino-acid deacylase
MRIGITALVASLLATSATSADYDLLIRGGTLYDGSGGEGVKGDIAVRGDRIVAIGRVAGTATRTIDATGLAVAPGFVNMLSQANEDLIYDGRGMSDLLQGVTLEVMGEGNSMGPWTPAMKASREANQGDIKYKVEWTTLGQYLDWLAKKGVSPNIASFVGAATVRVHEIGPDNIAPTPAQLAAMRVLVTQAMQEGAMGVSTGLIYTPGTFAKTPEITALASEAGKCGGIYISHMRSESDHLLDGVDELIQIARDSGAPAEIFHMKAAGRDNWDKQPAAIAKVEAARAAGLHVTADMYPYPISATGLDAAMPTWVQEGGIDKWIARLKDPAIRARVLAEMTAAVPAFDSSYRSAGGAEGTILSSFNTPRLKPLAGRTLADVARERGVAPEILAMDLVIEDHSRIGVFYKSMDLAHVRQIAALPWVSYGSDFGAEEPAGPFLLSRPHPRAYGTFARILGPWRREGLFTLGDAVRKLSALPAANLGITDRGRLASGFYADIVLFDPATVTDHATEAEPAWFATGVRDVLVNGVLVVKDGIHVGAKPGRVVRGPGWTGWPGGGACGKGRSS